MSSQYRDGSDPKKLDIFNIPLLYPNPQKYQQENWLLDSEEYWEKVGRFCRTDLNQLADPVGELWINGHKTYNGLNDKIPLSLARGLGNSLCLVHVEKLQLSVFKPGEAFGNVKRNVQGHFLYHGTEYRLWVTDPAFERNYLAKPDGIYKIRECFLTISLGGAFEDACYKLIAAIFDRESGNLS